jgi:DNA-binding LytR/AlgR family response regulator
MAFSCIIIEDQLPAQRILIRYIDDIPELALSGTFTDPLAALAFLRLQTVDLIFLDIHLPKISGMEFLKILPYRPKVILTTAFSEYALEGYEFDVVDYLLKPIPFERFLKAVSKVIYPQEAIPATPAAAAPPLNQATNNYVFVKSDRTIVKIILDSLIYIKAEGDYTRVFTEGKNYFLSYTLKYWLDVLPTQNFSRIHKSYIINIAFVEKIEGNQVFIAKEKKALPIGRSFREDFMRRIDLKE